MRVKELDASFIIPVTLRLPVRVKSPFKALVPAYSLDMLSPLFAQTRGIDKAVKGKSVTIHTSSEEEMEQAKFTIVEYCLKLWIVLEALIRVFADAESHQNCIHDAPSKSTLNNIGAIQAVHTILNKQSCSISFLPYSILCSDLTVRKTPFCLLRTVALFICQK
jgi:hypothetical protein